MNQLEAMSVFVAVAVAERRGFTAAARRLAKFEPLPLPIQVVYLASRLPSSNTCVPPEPRDETPRQIQRF